MLRDFSPVLMCGIVHNVSCWCERIPWLVCWGGRICSSKVEEPEIGAAPLMPRLQEVNCMYFSDNCIDVASCPAYDMISFIA